MEGRRVNHSAPKRNPLYVMFLCLVAAVFVLLIVVIVLGAKLGAAQKAAKGAETQIEELQEQVKKLEEEKKAAEDAANEPDEKLPGEDTPAVDPNETKEPDTSVSDSKRKVGWLDLTGHSEVTVLPKKVCVLLHHRRCESAQRPEHELRQGPARRPGHKGQGRGEGGQLDLRFRRQQVRLDQLGLSFHQAAGRGDLRQPEPHLRRIGKKRSAMRNAFLRQSLPQPPLPLSEQED